MKDILIENTDSTPYASFFSQQGLLEIKGVSIPEDTEEFYRPIFNALEDYIQFYEENGASIDAVFKFIYINTGTSATIVKILKILEGLDPEKYTIAIKWYHEEADEDMKDLGDYFNSFTSVPFEIISIEEIV
jgi:SiaC family regulatory phosphoprotein